MAKEIRSCGNVPPNKRNERRLHNVDYERYDEERFWDRYILTKNGFQDFLGIIGPDLSARNGRGNPIPAAIQLLLTLRFNTTGIFQLACGDLCEFSQPSACHIIKRISEAIGQLKNEYIRFPPGHLLPQTKLDFWRIGGFPGVVGTYDCTHTKTPCPGVRLLNILEFEKDTFPYMCKQYVDPIWRFETLSDGQVISMTQEFLITILCVPGLNMVKSLVCYLGIVVIRADNI